MIAQEKAKEHTHTQKATRGKVHFLFFYRKESTGPVQRHRHNCKQKINDGI